MPLFHNIKPDAIFIADSHYNKKRIDFSLFLDKIISKEITTSQLFLMGDMFDFLAYEIDYFKNINQDVINKINEISNNIELIYIEGNHDYNLENIFLNTMVIPRKKQAVLFKLNNTNVLISHGDIHTPLAYNIYSKIIRSKKFLKFINFIDINYFIAKKVENMLLNKNICHTFDDFKKFANTRISKYKLDGQSILIEGHFHQGKKYKNYINIPSLACGNKYMQVYKNEFLIKSL